MVLCALVGALTGAVAGQAADADEIVVFSSLRDGNSELYAVQPDGSGLERLTDHPALDAVPSLSPDGDRIAFASTREGNSEIYVMEIDGGGLVRLTNHGAIDSEPDWSPDGSQIAFTSSRSGAGDIYRMSAGDGTGLQRLTSHLAPDTSPAWSADGTQIAFSSLRSGLGDIYSMQADGTQPQRLTNSIAPDLFPAWSPDGERIAFSSLRSGLGDIYRMQPDGSQETRITQGLAVDSQPAWSPDGARLAISSKQQGTLNFDLRLVDADDGSGAPLAAHAALDASPDWGAAAATGAPPNDDFADAQPIGVDSATDGTLVGATTEPGEPSHCPACSGNSVWYSITPASDGLLTISVVSGSAAVRRLYTGSQLASLVEVPGTLDFQVEQGTTYYLAVDAQGTPGAISFTLSFQAGPPIITAGGDGAPMSTKVISASAVMGTSGDPAGTLMVTVPCSVTGGQAPLQVDDVLAAAIGEHTPNGLLRRVLSIGACSGGAVQVTTEPATLADAIPTGELDLSDDLSDLELPDFEPTTEDGFVRPVGTPFVFGGSAAVAQTAGAVGTFAEPGRFTYGCPSDPDEGGVELKVKPSFSYDPEVIFEADWDGDDVHLRTGFGIQGDLSIDLTATGSVVCDASFALINGHSLGTRVFFVGPVPVVVQPQLTLLANLEGKAEGSISTTASVTGSLSSTLQVDVVDGAATHSVASSNLVTGNLGQSFQAKVEATFTLEPSMSFLLYGIVAPTAKLSAGAKATFEPCVNPNLKLEAPLQFRAKLEPSEWLGELLEPLENLDLSVEQEFDFPGSPFLLTSAHIATPLPCEPTTTLPDGTTGQPYSEQLAVQIPEGAADPIYSVAGGSLLPDGLALSPTGLLAGTPTESGIYTFTVNVGHSLGSSSRIFELTVVEDSLRILTESLPAAQVGEPYSVVLQANRPASELVWRITSGSLPNGLTLDPDGTLAGTPSVAGSFPITVEAEHPDGDEIAETAFTIAVTTGGSDVNVQQTWSGLGPCRETIEFGTYPEGSGRMELSLAAQLQPDGGIALVAVDGSYDFDMDLWFCTAYENPVGVYLTERRAFASDGAPPDVTLVTDTTEPHLHVRFQGELARTCFFDTSCDPGTEASLQLPVTVVRDGGGTPIALDLNSSSGPDLIGTAQTATGYVPVLP
jgi:TolB protein